MSDTTTDQTVTTYTKPNVYVLPPTTVNDLDALLATLDLPTLELQGNTIIATSDSEDADFVFIYPLKDLQPEWRRVRVSQDAPFFRMGLGSYAYGQTFNTPGFIEVVDGAIDFRTQPQPDPETPPSAN